MHRNQGRRASSDVQINLVFWTRKCKEMMLDSKRVGNVKGGSVKPTVPLGEALGGRRGTQMVWQ